MDNKKDVMVLLGFTRPQFYILRRHAFAYCDLHVLMRRKERLEHRGQLDLCPDRFPLLGVCTAISFDLLARAS